MFSLKEDLTEYYRLIAVLQAQLNLDTEGAGGDATAGGTKGLTLQRLFVWVMDPLKRLNVMATLVSAAAQLKVGIAIYRHDTASVYRSGGTRRTERRRLSNVRVVELRRCGCFR